ncbi:MAG: hypothetical protein IJ383_00075 [Bacteroidales bacterium]|nr:hypothetical protein [Bacteroidales bacterium]
MKQTFIFLLLLLMSLNAKAQWIVHDVMGEITAIANSLEEVGVSSENLAAALESVEKSSRMLDIAVENVNKLQQVKKKIRNGTKVVEILSYSVQSGNEYTKLAKVLIESKFSNIRKTRHLSALYSLFCTSTQYVVELEDLITDNVYEMSDADRLRFINELHEKSRRNYNNIRYYGRKLMDDIYYQNQLDNDLRLLNSVL